jgi:hypothetical protein
MEYTEFERHATAVWEEIPDAYRSGVDGLVLEREAMPHPTHTDVYTLGECLTESYPSDWAGPETVRSVLVLYYGSFRALSGLDPDFDWDYEIWETITHELRHHLESLAVEDALEDVDYAVDENFKRLTGEPFDPFFYRSGEETAPGVYEAERAVFIEVELEPGETPGPSLAVDWAGRRLAVPAPAEPAEVSFLQVTGGVDTGEAELCIIVVQRRGWLDQLKDLVRRAPPTVLQIEVRAQER